MFDNNTTLTTKLTTYPITSPNKALKL